MREQEEEPMSLLHKNKFVRGLLLRVAVSRQTDLQGSAIVLRTRQPRYSSAEPKQTLIDLSSSVPTTFTMTLDTFSSGPIKIPTSTPSH